MEKKQCSTCQCYNAGIWIRGVLVAQGLGECHRGEPDTGDNPWPVVNGKDDWCGEWEVKK